MNQLRPFIAGAVWTLLTLVLVYGLVWRATNLPTIDVDAVARESTDG